ncbi:hypothetical protein ECZU17_49960 [Escherichia coli]|nr:hypothetical protein ECZU17_49960 [Escherichia coli]
MLTQGIIEMTGVAGVPDEEVFGPLLRVWRYDNFDEAIRMANNTRFGLSCGLVSPRGKNSINCCLRRGRGLLTGTNRLPALPVPRHSAALALPVTIAPAPGMPQIIVRPMASPESDSLTLPATLNPGLDFSDEVVR